MTSGLSLYIVFRTDRHQSRVGYSLHAYRLTLLLLLVLSVCSLAMATRANKSEVWKSFTKAASNEVRCNFCSKELAVTGGQTSSLHSHLHKHGKSKNVGLI